MTFSNIPICKPAEPCKCCGEISPIFGVVDFHRLDQYPPVFPLAGIPIYYHRCPNCRFLFTTAFDSFTHAEFAEHIYNEQYVLIDPDYYDKRPQTVASIVGGQLGAYRDIAILDYGGGSGQLAKLLKEAGFTDVDTYDPYNPAYAGRPLRRYDYICATEVFEHSTDPQGTFADIVTLMKDESLLWFTTSLQPSEIETERMNWWYVLPRNGHVSLHSRQSLGHLASKHGMTVYSADNLSEHAACREIPSFAASMFGRVPEK